MRTTPLAQALRPFKRPFLTFLDIGQNVIQPLVFGDRRMRHTLVLAAASRCLCTNTRQMLSAPER
jgi:hypothetical protein